MPLSKDKENELTLNEEVNLIFWYQTKRGTASIEVPIKRSKIVNKNAKELFYTVYQKIKEFQNTASQKGDSFLASLYQDLLNIWNEELKNEGPLVAVISKVAWSWSMMMAVPERKAVVISDIPILTDLPQHKTLEEKILDECATIKGRRKKDLYIEFHKSCPLKDSSIAIQLSFEKGGIHEVYLSYAVNELIGKRAGELLEMVSQDVKKNMNATKNTGNEYEYWKYQTLNAKLSELKSIVQSKARNIPYIVIEKESKPPLFISDEEIKLIGTVRPKGTKTSQSLTEELIKEYLQKNEDGTYYLQVGFGARIGLKGDDII